MKVELWEPQPVRSSTLNPKYNLDESDLGSCSLSTGNHHLQKAAAGESAERPLQFNCQRGVETARWWCDFNRPGIHLDKLLIENVIINSCLEENGAWMVVPGIHVVVCC